MTPVSTEDTNQQFNTTQVLVEWHSNGRLKWEFRQVDEPGLTLLVKPRFLAMAVHMDPVELITAEHDQHQCLHTHTH